MRSRRWFENLLLLGGLIALNVWVWAIAITCVSQSWESWVFDRELRRQPTAVTAFIADKTGDLLHWWGFPKDKEASKPKPAPEVAVAPPARNNELLGRLNIPRLGLTAMVRQGAGEETLRVALGHIPGTALPGQAGNVGVAGHRDTLFRGLRAIRKNDLIEFETLHGPYFYRVESMQIVKPTDVSVLNASLSPELTLVTCYPFYYVGSAPDRFIVKAREVQAPAGRNVLISKNAS